MTIVKWTPSTKPDSVEHRVRLRRDRLIRSVSHGGPLASASRAQGMQRQQMLRAQTRSRFGNPRPERSP